MATITTSWATYATQRVTWYDSYSARNWSADVSVEAYYTKINDTSITVHVREKVALVPPSGYNEWYGTNKYYNVNGNGRKQDTASLIDGSPHYFNGNDFTANAGSTFTISAYYEVMNNNTVTASASVTAPTFATKPATPTVSTGTVTATSIPVTYGTTSFGTPSSGTVYLYGGTGSAPTSQINNKKTTGNSTFTHTGLANNTRYYYRAGAYNGSLWSDYSTTVNAVTMYVMPTVSLGAITKTSVVVNYSFKADGGYYPKNLDISFDNSSWTRIKSSVYGSAVSGSSTISALTPGTNYTMYTRVAGHWTVTGPTLTFKTMQSTYVPYPNNPSGSNTARQVNKFYAPRSGLARQVTKLYDSYNGKARRIY